MFRDTVVQPQQDQHVMQAFLSLLTLLEALASVTEPEEYTARAGANGPPPITLAAAGKSFAEITKQVLNCKYVGVIAINPPGERQLLLGSSGLPPDEEQCLREDTYQTPLLDYLDAEDCEKLRANQIVTLDLKHRPFTTPRSIHGARYRLVAPLILHGKLIGIFTMAKTDEQYADVDCAYSPEERALARGIARLAAQVIEKVSLLQERAQALENEQKLQEATRRYEDFLSTASHELRTPLTTIKGNVQLAQRRLLTLARQVEPSVLPAEKIQRIEIPLREAMQNFNRLERMISELLDFSRIQADKFTMRKQPCNLVEIVRHAVEDARQASDGRTFLLHLPAAEVVPIIADADRVSEVVNNYLSNAHKYSQLALPIEVYLTVKGSQARVVVRDHGPGISSEEQTRIWERFYRAPGIETQEQCTMNSNLGLGLYLCKEIIELHQGHIGVSSAPGQGATFWFSLALAKVSCETEDAP